MQWARGATAFQPTELSTSIQLSRKFVVPRRLENFDSDTQVSQHRLLTVLGIGGSIRNRQWLC